MHGILMMKTPLWRNVKSRLQFGLVMQASVVLWLSFFNACVINDVVAYCPSLEISFHYPPHLYSSLKLLVDHNISSHLILIDGIKASLLL
jgi:hypothetical protein